MIKRIIPFAHDTITEYLGADDIAVDMTAGNGNDTLFLAQLCKHVYAFDIQEDAIHKTRQRLDDTNLKNVSLILDSHVNVHKYVKTPVRCAVYNLGYLPKGDKSITTTASTTIASLQQLLPLMMKNSLVSITVYIGHDKGTEESKALQEYVSTLASNMYSVLLYSNLNKNNAPYNIFIEKTGE